LGIAHSLRVAGLVALAAVLVVLAVPTAPARSATTFVHSAKSGELRGDRLILRGVGRRVAWITNSGRSGVVSVKRLHRRLFLPGRPATGVLHVTGDRGGDEQAFKLSRPRYNAARRRVSYRARRLGSNRPRRPVSRGAGFRRLRRFGAASLSILGAPQFGAGDNGGNDCRITITNNLPWELEASSEGKWPTDTWDQGIPFQYVLDQAQSITWGSDGGLFRGCSVSGGWTIISDPDSPPNPPQGTFNLNTTWEWNGGGDTGHTCTNTNSAQYYCQDWTTAGAGSGVWELKYVYPDSGR
jgi:hypothetical protein